MDFDYLVGVYRDKHAVIPRQNYSKAPRSKAITSLELFEVLQESLTKNKNMTKVLGFDKTRLPNKQFMLDLLFSIDPKNELFNVANPQSLTTELMELSKE